MKKLIILLVCIFAVSLFEGCANRAQTTYDEEEYEPAPRPKKTKTAPKPVAKPKPVATATTKREPDKDIVTSNLYPIPKAMNVDNDLTVVSLTPVAYTSQAPCNEVYFFSTIVTPASGYHGLVDISMSETETNGTYSCKYFGSAVVYKVKPNPFVREIVKYEDVVRKFVPDSLKQRN